MNCPCDYETTMIEFKNVSKAFGGKSVLSDVSLTVKKGEILYVIGTSGAGKSVMMKHLVGLFKSDAGEIFIDGKNITEFSEKEFLEIRKKCVLVFQHSTLFDSMTLRENVALPLRKHQNLTIENALLEADRFLDLVNMKDKGDLFPVEIGPGEQKQVAIVRALTMKPEYVIMDEPTTGLDIVSAANVDRLIKSLSAEQGVTCIIISHDLRSIFDVADRIIMLYKAKIRLDGTPEDFRNSADPVIRQFIAGMPEGPMEM
jgi:phospholipid/cholesterol/gamma-HCH transport system ATP-binding protein